ncbi:MAG TPA: fasciclin domain-containing protein [Sphingomicrobium sp.]|jgi:uncharacterized surface protein with fasciclin (FAS1) repeats
MRNHALAFGVAAAALLSLGACNKDGGNGNGARDVQTPQAEKAAGNQTIAAGLPANSQFMAAAKAAGLDQTLAGPGPYTVFVPTDEAIGKAPQGTFAATPENRAQLTGTITNLILPGTVLVADIDKAIDAGKGKTPLATISGGTLTASKEGGRTVLTDSAGNKAAIVQADQQFSNGVVHQLDALLVPGKSGGAAPAVGQKAGQQQQP